MLTFASAKGRDPFTWALLGFIFGIFALLYVAFAPRLEVYTTQPVAQPENNLNRVSNLDRLSMTFRDIG